MTHLRTYSWLFLSIGAAIACRSHHPPVVAAGQQEQTGDVLKSYRRHRLEPARIPPPTLSRWIAHTDDGSLEGSIELVRAEDQAWNRWSDDSSRLFNNRSAHFFQVDINPLQPGELLRWIPDRTQVEVNVEGNQLPAARSQEPLLQELVFWAFQQERSVLDGDLVERTRAAGELRRAYLTLQPEPRLRGLIAFPMPPPNTAEDADPSEQHVVSMRVTLTIERGTEEHTLQWLLE